MHGYTNLKNSKQVVFDYILLIYFVILHNTNGGVSPESLNLVNPLWNILRFSLL
jgi:hypothetical protein